MSAKKQVRILADCSVDGVPYACNDAVEFDAKTAADQVALGAADDSKEAVTYALGFAPLKKHADEQKPVSTETGE